MEGISKKKYKTAQEILKTGILRRHEQWLKELAETIAHSYDEETENTYDRSMAITRMARGWYKEASRMDTWYDKHTILEAINHLVITGFITDAELQLLNDCKGT